MSDFRVFAPGPRLARPGLRISFSAMPSIGGGGWLALCNSLDAEDRFLSAYGLTKKEALGRLRAALRRRRGR